MKQDMTAEQLQVAGYGMDLSQSRSPEKKKVKKASWFRTILWMFSMALLGNVIMAIIAYFLFFYHK